MTSPDATSFSVVIVNYRVGPMAAGAARSSLTAGASCVHVVDNASGPECREVLAPLQAHGIVLHWNTTNVGFGAACNQALAHCQTPYVLLLNPDAELNPASAAQAIEAFTHNPSLAAASPTLLDANGHPQRVAQRDPSALNYWADFSLFSSDRLRKAPTPPVQPPGSAIITTNWLTGAALWLRRSALLQLPVPGFDPRYFLYFEDADLCRRLRQQGGLIGHLPHIAPIQHRARQSSGSSPDAKFRSLVEFFRSFLLYGEQYEPQHLPRLRRSIRLDMRLRQAMLLLRLRSPSAAKARLRAYSTIISLTHSSPIPSGEVFPPSPSSST